MHVWSTSCVKVLANEDALLRIHCCPHKCFPVCPRAQHLLRTQILCPAQKKVSDFVQKHVVSVTDVSQFTQPKKHHGQQCVRNNVSLFIVCLNTITRATSSPWVSLELHVPSNISLSAGFWPFICKECYRVCVWRPCPLITSTYTSLFSYLHAYLQLYKQSFRRSSFHLRFLSFFFGNKTAASWK